MLELLFQLGTLVSYGITQQLLMDSIVASWSSWGKFIWELVMAYMVGTNSMVVVRSLSVAHAHKQVPKFEALCFCAERLK